MSSFSEALADLSNDVAVAEATLRLRIDALMTELDHLGVRLEDLHGIDPYDTQRILDVQEAAGVQFGVCYELASQVSYDVDGLKATLPLVQPSPAKTDAVEKAQAEEDAPKPPPRKAGAKA
jgi:hypothetical protein